MHVDDAVAACGFVWSGTSVRPRAWKPPMSDPRRSVPRSAVAAADLRPLTVALNELDSAVNDPAPTFAALARRLVEFEPPLPEDEVRGAIINLRPIALSDRPT